MTMKWWGWGAPDKTPDISNMPKFLPFVHKKIGDTTDSHPLISLDDILLSPPLHNQAFLVEIANHLNSNQYSDDKLSRIQHAFGKSFRDLWRIRKGLINRAPDLIIYPESHQQVLAIVTAAKQYDVCIIPFGGGTNIVGAFEPSKHEGRMIVSLNLRQMNQVVGLDTISNVATIQAGTYGPDLEQQLNQKGYTLGHFPDSFEFSTLGGWLATRSVGMQSDKYGTIADMTLSLKCITTEGTYCRAPYPHSSIGIDLNHLFLGSEGKLGIITEATMKVHKLPEHQRFAAILFPTFNDGVAAIQYAAKHQMLPHMMRLLDQEETELSFNFKPKASLIKQSIEDLVKKGISAFKRIDFSKCSIAILAFAGTKSQVHDDQKQILKVCKRFGGVYLGQKPGQQWFDRKYDYPYLRDLMMDYGFFVDVAETCVLWTDVLKTHKKIKEVAFKAISNNMAPDKISSERTGYVGCHLSHHYQSGTCLYFTFCFKPKDYNNIEYYWAVKKAITSAIIECKGALSHHHSIGYEHAPWLKESIGQFGADSINKIKQVMDPTNQFRTPELCQVLEKSHES